MKDREPYRWVVPIRARISISGYTEHTQATDMVEVVDSREYDQVKADYLKAKDQLWQIATSLNPDAAEVKKMAETFFLRLAEGERP